MVFDPPTFERSWTTKVPEMLEQLHALRPSRVFKSQDGKQYVEISQGYREEVEPDVFTRCGASTAEAFVLDMACDALEDMKWDDRRHFSYVVGKMSASHYFASITEWSGPLTDDPYDNGESRAIRIFGGEGSSRAEAALDGLLKAVGA